MRTLLVLVLTCSFLVCGSHAARADDAAASYDESIRRAIEEYSLGHWTEAHVFFSNAHALNPNARTLRGLGLTCYELRNYVEAIGYFKQALQSREQPLTEKMHADIEQLLQQSEQFVTRVSVKLAPATADFEVDHVAYPLGRDGVVLLDPGVHELSASATGHHSEQRTIDAKGGELRVQLQLRALDAAVAPAALAALAARRGSGPGPYILIGVSAAALAGGAALFTIATLDKHAIEHSEAGQSWPDLEPRYNRTRIFFPLSFALMGAGLAGVAVGLTWQLWPTAEKRAPSAQLRVSPLAIELGASF